MEQFMGFIKNLLRTLGMPAHLSGYNYILAAFEIVYENPSATSQMMKVIYPQVAAKYNKTPAAVERAMRSAVEKAWDRGNLSLIYQIFGYTIEDGYKPTNKEFLTMVTDRIMSLEVIS